MTTIQTLARALESAFVADTRANGDTFYKLADGSPEWMAEAVRDAHGEMLPDDWRYAAIRAVAGEMAELDEHEDDAMHERVDGLVDIYNARLTAWLGSSLARIGYCDEAAEEYGAAALDGGIIKMIQLGQYAEYQDVWTLLAFALRNEAEAQNAA